MFNRILGGHTERILYSRVSIQFVRFEFFPRSILDVGTGTSSSHQRVKPEHFLDLEIAIPKAPLVAAFSRMAKPLYDRVASILKQSVALASVRDALVPKILSAEIRIKDAEKLAETTP
jgi:type I restriction enzyme S subunit